MSMFTPFDSGSSAEHAPPPSSKSGHRVLIVESDVETADTLAQILDEDGHGVQIAADAKTALLQLDQFQPDLVLLGTYLSDMPGYEMTQILRGAPQYAARFRYVHLLYVADRNKLLKHRFSGLPEVPVSQYIFKPLHADEVRSRINKAFETIEG